MICNDSFRKTDFSKWSQLVRLFSLLTSLEVRDVAQERLPILALSSESLD